MDRHDVRESRVRQSPSVAYRHTEVLPRSRTNPNITIIQDYFIAPRSDMETPMIIDSWVSNLDFACGSVRHYARATFV